jgi:CBS domain-containing protein
MKVQDIMTRNPATCTLETSLQEVARMMVDCDCGAIPVVNEMGEPMGIVTDRDITCRTVAMGMNPLEMRAGDVMTPNVIRVSLDESVDNVLRVMEKNQIRRVVVMDGRCCVGIVSQGDLALNLEEELVGEMVEDISRPGRGPSSPSAHMHNENHISRGRPERH